MFINNFIFLEGFLTKDAETKQTSSGKAVTTFSIGVNRYISKDQREVSYFDVASWAQEVADAGLKKGQAVSVSGELRQERWKDKDGNHRTSVKVNASSVSLTIRRAKQEQAANVQKAQIVQDGEFVDDVPF